MPLSAFSKSYKGRCKECVAKQTREKRNGIIATDKPKQIDWEQRRYENIYDNPNLLKQSYIATNAFKQQVMVINNHRKG